MADNPTQVIIRLGSGVDVLVDLWPSGTADVSVREPTDDVWCPVELRGGSVRVVAGSVGAA